MSLALGTVGYALMGLDYRFAQITYKAQSSFSKFIGFDL